MSRSTNKEYGVVMLTVLVLGREDFADGLSCSAAHLFWVPR